MPRNNSENDVSYFFQVKEGASQYFQIQMQDSDTGLYYGQVQCYSVTGASNPITGLRFDENWIQKNYELKSGDYYQVTVTDDYRFLLSEYDEKEGTGKTVFDINLRVECPRFEEQTQEPGMPSDIVGFSVDNSVTQYYLVNGVLTDQNPSDTTEAADTTTTSSETTTSSSTTTTASSAEAAPVTETDAQTQTEAITTTSGGGGFIERAMNADTKTLYGIIGVCAAVVIGGIALYVFLHRRDGKKEKEFDYTSSGQSSKIRIPKPQYLEKLDNETWEHYVEQARQKLGQGASRKDIENIAVSLADADIKALHAHGTTAKPHSGGRGHMGSLNDGYDTTIGEPDSRPEERYPAAPASSDDNGGLGDLTVPTSLQEVNGVNPPSGHEDSSDPAAQYAQQSAQQQSDSYVQQSAPKQPEYPEQPAYPEPASPPPAADENPFTEWEAAANLAAVYDHFEPNRQFDGSYILIQTAGTGHFIGQMLSGDRLRVLLNPGAFQGEYPFWSSGVQMLDQFFAGAKRKGGAVRSVKGAICVAIPGKPGEYQCETKGTIEQDD